MSDIGEKIRQQSPSVPAPANEVVNRQLFNQADFAISENALGPNRPREIAGKIAKCAAARNDKIRWRIWLAIKFTATSVGL